MLLIWVDTVEGGGCMYVLFQKLLSFTFQHSEAVLNTVTGGGTAHSGNLSVVELERGQICCQEGYKQVPIGCDVPGDRHIMYV